MSSLGQNGAALLPSQRNARILVVDDQPEVRGIVSFALARAGYVVAIASDALEAMAACERESFDLLLSDVVMPGINGHKLAQWVAKEYPTTLTALMTGYDQGCLGCPYSPRCKIIRKPFLP